MSLIAISNWVLRKSFIRPTVLKSIRKMSSASSVVGNKVEVNGVNIYYEKAGHGKQTLLLLPGALGSCATDFRPQLEGGLNYEKFTVICWDPRGYGNSRPPDRDFPVDFFYRDADDAGKLMDVLGHKRYSALGWSDGANVAMILAAKRSEAVEKLAVWGGNAYCTDKDIEMYELTKDISNWSERMRAPMIKVYGKEYFQNTWSAWVDGFKKINEERRGDVCIAELRQIKCPTLILHGELDPMVGHEHPVFLQSGIAGSRMLVMPGAKHNPHLRYAKEFNQHLETFLLKEEPQSKI
ncbi:valacyclovir hydrolase-like [Amphiura filiformis]|uniref:valacyclovir hydrolase-like n=1 Tax=Amphiura filiformis TaxID=82378 RepID=UPI003B20ED1E